MSSASPSSHPYPSEPTRIVHVGGSDYDIGYQHAVQVGEAASKGMAKFYYDFWKRMMGSVGESGWEAPLLRVAKRLVDPVLINKLASQLPEYAQERLRGVSAATGRSVRELATAMVLPDLMPILEVVLSKLRPNQLIEVLPPPMFGCSSFIARGQSFLHGRNLDFPGVGYWDRYPVIQVTHPRGKLKYVGFTTAGAPLAGITGVNEAQISVSLHQHYCREASFSGTLPFVIGEEILSRARSLVDAKKILQTFRLSSSWAFILTDGKTREGMIYEGQPRTSGAQSITDQQPVLAHSNFFQTAQCRPSEFAATSRMNWDNYCRKSRLETNVRNAGEGLTAAQAAVFLSEHYDPFWEEEKPVNRTVSQAYNIQSLVLDSEKMKVYFAEGNAPVHFHEYHEYDLGELLAGRSGASRLSFSGYQFSDPKKKAAKQSYIFAFVDAFEGNLEKALVHLGQAREEAFVPEVAYVEAVLAMRLGNLQRGWELLEEAKAFVENKARSAQRSQLPPEYFEISLFSARALDLLGRRGEAVKRYQEISAHGDLQDPNLRRIATKARAFTPKRLAQILMPFSSYIHFD
jgi:Acyl-coenzyme A:6-aminopenicillanic acid acyl-transferase